MKANTKALTGFLNKAMMSGEQEISECVLKFENDGLKVSANSAAKQARVVAWLKSSAFPEYDKDFGNIGVNNLSVVNNVLERFADVTVMKKEGNLLTVSSPGKKVEIELISESFLDTDIKEPELNFDDTFTISAQKIKEIFKDVKLNKDAVIKIATKDKKVVISNTGKYKFTHELDSITCKGDVSVEFGQPLIDTIAKLDGDLDISVKTNYPMKITERTEDSVVTIIVAPRIADE